MEKHALLIGVGQYPTHALPPLPAAVNDAKALGAVLRHPEMGGFPDANVILLEDPDRQAMETAIEELFSGRAKDDLALLYFSGHGLKDDAGRLYLATGSTRKTPNGELVRATAVSASAVHENMERSRARRQVVILDSCYSGAFPAEYAIKDDGTIDLPGQLLPHAAPPPAKAAPGGEGQAILTASTASRYAFEQDDEALSLYTRFLIRGIETGEADGNDNGFVTVGELHEYARGRVQAVQPAMRPGIYLGGGGGAIRVAGVPVGDPSARYAKAVGKSLDHRGEIAIAARPRLDDWRERLGLDTASYDAIEEDAMAARRKEFDGKCQEYGQTVREILKQGKRLADEAEKTNLADYRQRLGLDEEDAQAIQAGTEKEVAAEGARHKKDRQLYAASFREAIRMEEGPEGALTEATRARLARFQQELALSHGEAKEIREEVRRGEKKPSPKEAEPWWKRYLAADALITIVAGVLTIVASALAIWSFWGTEPDRGGRPLQEQTSAGDRGEPKSRQDAGAPRGAPGMTASPTHPGAVPGSAALQGGKSTGGEAEPATPGTASVVAQADAERSEPQGWAKAPPGAMPILDPEMGTTRSALAHPTPTPSSRQGMPGPSARDGKERSPSEVQGSGPPAPAIPAPPPKPARLTIHSNVTNDTVTIDGEPVGPTGPTVHERPPGEYTVRVEKAGYEPFERGITLAPGQEKTVRATLAFQTFRDRLRDGGLGPGMMVLPAGKFVMGSPEGEAKRNSDESPRHPVRIPEPFALGVTEVTFADYDRFAKATGRELPDDRKWGRNEHPVINVSWEDATEYAEWLSGQTGEDYRLPTEAEWEYAARAGTDTPFSTGECIHTDQANYAGNHDYAGCGARTGVYRGKTVPAGSLPANPWGLHGMHGNVWEWTADCWHGDYENAPEDGRAWGGEDGGDCGWRVDRGGSWGSGPRVLRSANRYRFRTNGASGYVGFRLARAL